MWCDECGEYIEDFDVYDGGEANNCGLEIPECPHYGYVFWELDFDQMEEEDYE